MKRHTLWILLLLLLTAGCASRADAVDPSRVVSLSGRLSRKQLPADTDSTVYVELELGPGELPPASGNGNVNVALVIDTSGSMAGDAIEHAKNAAKQMIEQLSIGDRVALVTFDTRPDVLMKSTVIDADNRRELVQLVDGMRARGTTSMAEGLWAAIEQVQEHHDPEGINRIVLLSDGVPNTLSGIEASASNAGAQGISITAMGLGIDYDEVLLASIAERSGGRYRYVESPDKVASFFADEVLRLQNVYAKNAQLSLLLGPDVNVEVLGRTQVSHDGEGRVRIELGDLSQRDTLRIYARLEAKGRADGAPVEILDAQLSYQVGDEDARQELYLGAKASADAALTAAIDREVEHRAVLAEAAHATLQAVAFARAGNRASADAMIDSTVTRLEAQSAFGKREELGAQIQELRELQNALPEPEPVEISIDAEAAESYDFSDDALVAPAAQSVSPEKRQKILETYDRAVQQSY